MTGKELIERINEIGAEEMDVLCIKFNGMISSVENVDVAEDAATKEKKVVMC